MLAFKRTKLIPRQPATIELTAMVTSVRADTADKVVDHFIRRFLRVPLAEQDRTALVDFLRAKLGTSIVQPSPQLEGALRELLYLVLSAPEYQVG
jgi:GH24 family phage-related lysozyme (muramidase)